MILVGECKWTREPVGLETLAQLRRVAPHVPGVDDRTRLALFGRAFDPALSRLAAEEGVLLVTPDELYS